MSMQVSSISKKTVMSLTGILLTLFLIGHLSGNLLIFLGPDALNAYAEKMTHLGALVWVVRAGLLATVTVHILVGGLLAAENRRARPVGYAAFHPVRTTPAARSMLLSGALILAFIVYHLLHFTVRVTHPELAHLTDVLGRHDTFAMVVYGFQQWPVALGYLVSMGILAAHLSHGVGSMPQSIGLNDERTLAWFTGVGRLLAAGIGVGFMTIPASIWLGLLTVPSGGR